MLSWVSCITQSLMTGTRLQHEFKPWPLPTTVFTVCSCMFSLCSLYVQSMFPVCSAYVPCKFSLCSLYVYSMFTLCMFILCSLYVHISTTTINHPIAMATPIIYHAPPSSMSHPARHSRQARVPASLSHQCFVIRDELRASILSASLVHLGHLSCQHAEASVWLSLSLSLPSPPLRAHGNTDCGHTLPEAS